MSAPVIPPPTMPATSRQFSRKWVMVYIIVFTAKGERKLSTPRYVPIKICFPLPGPWTIYAQN